MEDSKAMKRLARRPRVGRRNLSSVAKAAGVPLTRTLTCVRVAEVQRPRSVKQGHLLVGFQSDFLTAISCARRGWKDFARLRNHLAPVHKSYACITCDAVLSSRSEMELHSDQDGHCTHCHNSLDAIEDRNTHQCSMTRSTRTDAEKWKSIYQILFPGDPVPEPFVDDEAFDPGGSDDAVALCGSSDDAVLDAQASSEPPILQMNSIWSGEEGPSPSEIAGLEIGMIERMKIDHN